MLRGEIYLVDLDPVKGREQYGKRPVLVVCRDEIIGLPLVVAVVPGTNGSHVGKDLPWNVRIPAADSGLRYETVFLCFQIRALDHSRFPGSPIGSVSAAWMEKIEAALEYALELP